MRVATKLCLGLVGLLCFCSPGSAVIGTIDNVPAATLLLPYFEVDIANSAGVNTLLSVNNASSAAVLAHVTVWTDQGVPGLAFEIYLTGYDIQTIDLRDIFVNGNLPRTASDGQDASDAISPQGQVSQDIDLSSCSALPYSNPALSPSYRAHLQAWFQGNQSPVTGNCAGSKTQDNIMRGYVTIDTVNACNLFFPSDFALYAPFLTFQNVLWGEYFLIDAAQNGAEGHNLVPIEACVTCFAPGGYHTFYGRYNEATAADAREPLPPAMFASYETLSASTEYVIWRETNDSASGYSCSLEGPPSWYPLEMAGTTVLDDSEQLAETEEYCPAGDPTCEQQVVIPNAAQRIDVAADLLVPFDRGWAMVALHHPATIPEYGDVYAQMWLTTAQIMDGRRVNGASARQSWAIKIECGWLYLLPYPVHMCWAAWVEWHAPMVEFPQDYP